MKALRRIAAVARVETLRLLRDPHALSMILVVPALQMLLFGYAVNLNPRGITLAIARAPPSATHADDWLSRSIESSGYFTVVGDALPSGEARRRVAHGEALIAIEVRAGTAAQSPSLQVIADGSDPSAVRPALLTLQSALTRAAGESALGLPLPGVEVQWLYNPEQRGAWAIAPGLAGVVVMITMLMLGALTLVREREQGSWAGLLATPVTALDALVGKLAPYLLLGLLQATAVIAVAHLCMQLPLRGDLLALLCGALLLSAAHLVLGFALSALAENQLQAVQGAVFFYLPSMLLSGFMFPFQGMPRWAQDIGNLLPLTHFVRAARGVLLRGEDARFVALTLWPVAVFTVLAGFVAVFFYRRRLD